ncbi:MAG: MMPL family transporter [Pseudomonadales bacterium]|nr:MMPL family transporter [Pseudomonadales bacterium]
MATIKFNLKYLHWGTLALVILFALIAPSAPSIKYHSEITDFFDPRDPTLATFNRITESYSTSNDLVILLKAKNNDILSYESLSQLYDYVHYLEKKEDVDSVTSILDTPITNTHQELLTLKQFFSRNQLTNDAVLGQLSENITNSVFLASIEHSLFALQVSLSSTDNNTNIDSYLLAAKNYSFSHSYYTGPIAIKNALHRALYMDMTRLAPFILLSGILILWYFLRSWWLILVATASLILTLGITTGLISTMEVTVNQTSSLAFSVAFIIALANNIHLLTSYRQHLVENRGKPQVESLRYAIKNNAVALLLTTITTCIGFLSLNTSHSPVFATFGNIAACGVVVAYLCTLTITYTLLSFRELKLARSKNDVERHNQLQVITRYFERHSTFASKRINTSLYVMTFIAATGILYLQTHNDPIDYFPEDFSIREASKLSNQAFGLHHPIYLEIDTLQADGVFTSSFLRTLHHFKVWVEAQESVTHAYSFIDQLSLMQPALREHNLKWANAPQKTQVINDLINLQGLSNSEDIDLVNTISSQNNTALVTLAIGPITSKQFSRLEEKIEDWFEEHSSEYRIRISGHGLLFSNIGASLTSNMLWGGFFSALIISLLIGVFLGNWRLSFITLIPNLLPATVVFGLFGWLYGTVDLAAAGTLSISIGIVVDDSIHILKHYIDYRKQGYPPEQCASLTLKKVGPALILTTLVLSTGMGIMAMSVFGPNQTTAIFLSAIISIALLYDLILLPSLLRATDKWIFSEAITFPSIDQRSP